MSWIVDKDLKYKIVPTHISTIMVGDTIKCRDGVIRTICPKNIRHDKFIGTRIFGDSYNLGYIPVDKVVFFHAR